MSTDGRTCGPRVKVSLFGYDLYEAYIGKRGPSASWHKRKESRKARHMDAKQWQADLSADVNTSDTNLCVGLGCCALCDWDESWWPMLFADSTRAIRDAEWLRVYWRPKISDIMVDNTVYARHLGDGFGGTRVYGTSTRWWITLMNKLNVD